MRGVKTKAGGRWKRLAVFLILITIFGLLVNSVTGVYQKKKNAEELLVRMEAEKQELEDRERQLDSTIDRLSTEEGMKFEIKKKLNVAEAGESVAIVVAQDEELNDEAESKSTWQKIKDFFGGWFD